MRRYTVFLVLFVTHALMADISVIREGNDLTVHIDGQLFTEYRTDRHVPCLYPLMSPDGTHLTRQFPFVEGVAGEQADHPHHISFWFTHGSVNGHDFWHGKAGEKILTRQLQELPSLQSEDGANVRFSANLDWMAGEEKTLSETRVFTITALGTDRIIDVTCQLHATERDLIFGDTKEGSFALRVAPTMRLSGEVAEGGITNSEGIEGRKAWGKRAKWVAFHGPDSAGTPTVAAILDHPDNLRHPTWWHARDYGLLTANPFGAKAYGAKDFKGSGDYTLKTGETLTLKYRLLLHQGDVASAKLDERWAEFTGERTVLALGDSITAGGKGYPTYREFLGPELAKHGLHFIGPRRDAHTTHAGFGGRDSGFLLEKIDGIYRKHPADFVLLHSGHNHFAKDEPVPQILKDTEAIVRAIHAINPKAMVLIAQPITAGKLPKYSYLPELNKDLPQLVAQLKQEGLPVALVDQATGFDWERDTLADKVHPNETGARKMAARWLEALMSLIQ